MGILDARANNMTATSPDTKGETLPAVSLRHLGPDEIGLSSFTTESHGQGRELKGVSSQ